MVKYVLVTGGVLSGIGKGIVASSTGFLLKSLGYRVTAIKIDPYLNVDAGTLSPFDHGEVFVLDDGGEVDLDLGNYERFLDITLHSDNNITTGKIYREVIEKERRGDYLGKTVQVVPHVTDAIQDWIERVSLQSIDDVDKEPDVCIIELGGTVGDIESAPFIEAMRQFQFRVGHENFLCIHVSLVPVVGSVGEQKSKPTQASVRELRGLGISPDIIVCRCSKPIEESIKTKLSMFCHVSPQQVISVHDCPSVYHVPLLLQEQGLIHILVKRFQLECTHSCKCAENGLLVEGSTNGLPSTVRSPLHTKSSCHAHISFGSELPSSIPSSLSLEGSVPCVHDQQHSASPGGLQNWIELCQRMDQLKEGVRIALVGKYTDLKDSYLSVIKALQHASLACHRKLLLEWIEAAHLEPLTKMENTEKYQDAWQRLCTSNGVLVPGGFGERGTEGKILACSWARTMNVPYLGICLGLQIAVIEFARNVLKLEGANSTELEENPAHPVVIYMPEISRTHKGGTMRLGKRATRFVNNCITKHLYGNVDVIYERHRHRYEVNTQYVPQLEKNGLHFVGHDDSGERMEILEIPSHPFFVATQYHPEFKTRLLRPSPVFLGFIMASSGQWNESVIHPDFVIADHPSSKVPNGNKCPTPSESYLSTIKDHGYRTVQCTDRHD